MKCIKISLIAAILIILSIGSAFTQQKKIVDETRGFSLEKPANWESSNQLSPGGAYFQLKSPGMITEKVVIVTVIVQESGEPDVGKHAAKLIKQYKLVYKDMKISEEKAIVLNDVLFATFTAEYKFNGMDYKMDTIYAMKNGKVYQINAIIPVDVYDNKIEAVNGIVNSFKILY